MNDFSFFFSVTVVTHSRNVILDDVFYSIAVQFFRTKRANGELKENPSNECKDEREGGAENSLVDAI